MEQKRSNVDETNHTSQFESIFQKSGKEDPARKTIKSLQKILKWHSDDPTISFIHFNNEMLENE